MMAVVAVVYAAELDHDGIVLGPVDDADEDGAHSQPAGRTDAEDAGVATCDDDDGATAGHLVPYIREERGQEVVRPSDASADRGQGASLEMVYESVLGLCDGNRPHPSGNSPLRASENGRFQWGDWGGRVASPSFHSPWIESVNGPLP